MPPTPTTELLDAGPVGDVAAALAAAEKHAQVVDSIDEADVHVVAHRSDRQLATVDLERFRPAPRRSTGAVKALTADGFVDAFTQRVDRDGGSPASVYADIDHTVLVAVLNDDEAGLPGWRDHRVTFEPQPTPEWTHWVTHQGLGPQDRFATTIEDGETDILDPPATVMLDIAQTFTASTGARFKQHGRLADGRTQLVYEEDIEASAGESGEVKIPATFTIRVRPFYGADPVDVPCRLRYICRGGKLEIGYVINRPEEIVRAAFESVVADVAERLAGYPVIAGTPAPPVTAGR